MPRAKRLDVPGVAQHVIQRGNDRQACFFHEADYLHYLQDCREAASQQGCEVHAYVLMTNHVHMLITPGAPGAVARMMQTVGRRYVRYVNDSAGRSGTLWEGRYKASLVDNERYVLACYRYIELNPVRAGMVESPQAYRWSSFAANGCGLHDPLVTPHAMYERLAADVGLRCAHYRALVDDVISDEDMAAIRLYAQRQRALGSFRSRRRSRGNCNDVRIWAGRDGRARKRYSDPCFSPVFHSADGWTPGGGYNEARIERQAQGSVDASCNGSTEGSCK